MCAGIGALGRIVQLVGVKRHCQCADDCRIARLLPGFPFCQLDLSPNDWQKTGRVDLRLLRQALTLRTYTQRGERKEETARTHTCKAIVLASGGCSLTAYHWKRMPRRNWRSSMPSRARSQFPFMPPLNVIKEPPSVTRPVNGSMAPASPTELSSA